MNAVVVSNPATRPMLSINPFMVLFCVLKKRAEPAQRGSLGEDDVSRYSRDIAGEPSLCFEAGAKRRAREIVPQPGHDTAADITARARAQRDHQVGGRGAEDCA